MMAILKQITQEKEQNLMVLLLEKWEGSIVFPHQLVVKKSLMLIMLIGAAIFSPFVAVSRLPMDIAAFIGTADVAPWVVLVMIISSYSILGCFIHNIPLLLLTIPVFFPIVMGLGYDPIWFGVIVVVLGEIAIITPPVGINLYIVKGVAEYIPLSTIYKGIMPFIMVLLFSVSLLVAFPKLSTFLPELVKGLWFRICLEVICYRLANC